MAKDNRTLVCLQAGKPLHFAPKGTKMALVYPGRIKIGWSAGGRAQEKTVMASSGVPYPGSFRFDPAPDASGVTVEALPGTDGAVKGEILGVTSLQLPSGAGE